MLPHGLPKLTTPGGRHVRNSLDRPIANGRRLCARRKLDSIPFSGYHILIITVLALVGFIEGYDLVMTGSLLMLAKAPLHLTDTTPTPFAFWHCRADWW
jgi:hypothetical protein